MKHLKRVVALALVCIFAVGMLAACGGSDSPAPAGSGAAGSGSSGTVYVDTGEYTGPEMTLTVNFASPDYNNVYMMDAFERITQRTGGKVKFEPYYINGLLSLTEALDGLGNGLADISDITLSNYPAQFVYTTQLCALPFAGYQDILTANDIVRDVILKQNNEMMMKEFTDQNIKPFSTSAIYGSALMCHNDINIEKPEDLKGLKVMTQDIVFSNFLNSVGAIPVSHQVL
ncbi:MAG: hypothetical protein IKE48_01530, partial [Parasporobacterium sp.]|nr:hypothetical protein [Parasporobacterium sp.]